MFVPRTRHRTSRRRGSAIIEFAVVAPLAQDSTSSTNRS